MFVVVTLVAVFVAVPAWAIAITALVGIEIGLVMSARMLFRSAGRLEQNGSKFECVAVRLAAMTPLILAVLVYLAAMARLFSFAD
jgi:hypothetical protein